MRHDVGRAGWTVAGLAIAVVLAPALLGAQELTLRGTTTAGGKQTPTVTYISPIGTRSSAGGADGEVILRLDQKKVYILDNRQKTYNAMTFDDLQKMGDAATQGMENLPPEAMAQMKKMMGGMMGDVTVTPAGPGENIAGYATEKYHVTMGTAVEMDMWVAPALTVPPQYYDAMKAAVPANPMFDMRRILEEFKKVKGMQLKSVTNIKMMGRAMSTTNVVNTVDKGPIPPGTFDVPAGFKPVSAKH